MAWISSSSFRTVLQLLGLDIPFGRAAAGGRVVVGEVDQPGVGAERDIGHRKCIGRLRHSNSEQRESKDRDTELAHGHHTVGENPALGVGATNCGPCGSTSAK